MVQVRQFPWEVLEYIVSEVPTTYRVSVLPRTIQMPLPNSPSVRLSATEVGKSVTAQDSVGGLCEGETNSHVIAIPSVL